MVRSSIVLIVLTLTFPAAALQTREPASQGDEMQAAAAQNSSDAEHKISGEDKLATVAVQKPKEQPADGHEMHHDASDADHHKIQGDDKLAAVAVKKKKDSPHEMHEELDVLTSDGEMAAEDQSDAEAAADAEFEDQIKDELLAVAAQTKTQQDDDGEQEMHQELVLSDEEEATDASEEGAPESREIDSFSQEIPGDSHASAGDVRLPCDAKNGYCRKESPDPAVASQKKRRKKPSSVEARARHDFEQYTDHESSESDESSDGGTAFGKKAGAAVLSRPEPAASTVGAGTFGKKDVVAEPASTVADQPASPTSPVKITAASGKGAPGVHKFAGAGGGEDSAQLKK